MTRLAALVLFLAVVLAVAGLMHSYVWMRLIRDPALPAPWRQVATVFFVAGGVNMVGAMIVRRQLSNALADTLVGFSLVWLGLLFLSMTAFAATDVLRLLGGVLVKIAALGDPMAPERRLLLTRAIAVVGGGAALLAGAWGGLEFRRGAVLRTVSVMLPRLPEALDGLRIVQLSDLHLGPLRGRAQMAEIVARSNALKPDLVAITGDLVDGPVRELADAVAPLADLKARYGVYFVTGNHEYYAGVAPWLGELRRLGVRVLRNEGVSVGPNTASILVAGVDDPTGARHTPHHGPDVATALATRQPDQVAIVLAHQPRLIEEAAAHDVDLMLSGHTHGGQIWPFGYLVRLSQPYLQGLHRHGGQTLVYVSRGTGTWGPPMRLGGPSELTLLRLRSGANP